MEQNEVLKALQRDHAAELKLAAERLKGTARHTEIIPSKVLSDMTGHEILLKPENLQVTGSFKIRGAYNKRSLLRVMSSWLAALSPLPRATMRRAWPMRLANVVRRQRSACRRSLRR